MITPLSVRYENGITSCVFDREEFQACVVQSPDASIPIYDNGELVAILQTRGLLEEIEALKCPSSDTHPTELESAPLHPSLAIVSE